MLVKGKMRNAHIVKQSVLGSFGVKFYVKNYKANLSIGSGMEDLRSLAVGVLRALRGRSQRSLRFKIFVSADLLMEHQ